LAIPPICQNATILYQNATSSELVDACELLRRETKESFVAAAKFDSKVQLSFLATCLLERPLAKSGSAKLIRSRVIHDLGVMRTCSPKRRSNVRAPSPKCTAKARDAFRQALRSAGMKLVLCPPRVPPIQCFRSGRCQSRPCR
jgi:hypothetical protein